MITKQTGGRRAFQAEEATPLRTPNIAVFVERGSESLENSICGMKMPSEGVLI